MAAFLSDTFTDSSGSSIGLNTHTPDTGTGAWVQSGSLFGSSNSGTMQIRAGENTTRTTITTGYASAYNNQTPPSADTKITAKLGRGNTASASQPGLLIRADPTNNNCYYFRCASDQTTLFKIVGGTRTQIGQTTAVSGNSGNGVADNSFAIFTFQVKGNVITITRNSVQLLQVTDNSISANGYVGVISTSQGYVDDFSAEDAFTSIASADLSAAGSGTFSGAGAGVFVSALSSSGSASSNLIAATIVTGFWNSDGAGAAGFGGLALSVAEADLSATGTSSVTFRGTGIGEGSLSSSGAASSDLQTAALSVGEAELFIDGSSEFAGEGGSIAAAHFSISPDAEAEFVGGWTIEASFSMEGTASFDATPDEEAPPDPSIVSATFSSAGTSTAAFAEYAPINSGRVNIAGDAHASFAGGSIAEASIAITGQVTRSFFEGTGILVSSATMGGTATVQFRKLREVAWGSAQRTVAALAEDRVVILAEEGRQIVMSAAPSRTIALSAEARDVTVPAGEARVMILQAESRSVDVPQAESRSVTLTFEDRSIAA